MSWKTTLRKAALEALSATRLDRALRARAGGLGLVFTLHHVRPARSNAGFAPNAHLEVTPEFLGTVLTHVRARGFEIVSLDEIGRRLAAGVDGPLVVAFTLDDGYADNAAFARPVFERHRAPFTVFVASGLIDRAVALWWRVAERAVSACSELTVDLGAGAVRLSCRDLGAKNTAFARIAGVLGTAAPERVDAVVADLARQVGIDPLAMTDRAMMTWDELRTLAADPLATIGAHTLTHPCLAALDEERARSEMRGSADVLEHRLGARPRHFAYPYGYPAAAGPREFALARDTGFSLAVTTRPGVLFPEHAAHPTALPRVSLNGHFQSLRAVDVLMSGAPFALASRFRRLDVG